MSGRYWYAVNCLIHGRQALTEAQYDAGLDNPDLPWKCPKCGKPAEWDGECDA